jgi:sugar lactone lactonase YvrE
LRRLGEIFPDEVVVIGVHSAKFSGEEATRHLRDAVLRHGILHPVVNDAGHEIWQHYTVRAWPTLVVIDPEQRIVETWTGEVTADQLADIIRPVLKDHAQRGTLLPAAMDARTERSLEPSRPLAYPSKVLLRPDRDRLYVADTGHHRLLELALEDGGRRARLLRSFGSGRPGFADGPAERSRFHAPHGMAISGERLFVADTENHAIRAIDLKTGDVQTLAGTGQKASGGQALGKATETALRSPWALESIEHLLFIAMAGSHQIWVLIDGKELGPFAGNGREALVDGSRAEASFNQPSDLALGLGHLFVADAEASAIRAVSLGAEPRVFTLVGLGLFEWGDRDGVGGEARLQHPTGLCILGDEVLLADSYNHKIKTLDPTNGQLRTLMGSGRAGHLDGPMDGAEFYEPQGIAAAGAMVYIADTNNHAIRVADLDASQLDTLEISGLAPPEPELDEARA